MVEWGRRLDDFARKGWHNQVEVLTGPTVEYVGITNREDDTEDRVTVRLSAELRAVVVDRNGNVIQKKGEDSDRVSLAEYWTLARRGDRWMVVSIEQDDEGLHHLDAPLVPAPWSDDERLRDEAIVEQAAADAAPAGTKVAELVDVDFAHDARLAALDLSAVDERFAPHVLEVAARRAVSAWAEAVDGEDDALLAVAGPDAVDRLLYGGDATRTTRTVVRGPRLEAMEIVALDGQADPPSFTVAVRVSGRRYVENRDTLAVVSGSRDDETTFTERWRLVLGSDPENPWKLG
jgi:predicted lipid-binding transport protein (Tim44 family)